MKHHMYYRVRQLLDVRTFPWLLALATLVALAGRAEGGSPPASQPQSHPSLADRDFPCSTSDTDNETTPCIVAAGPAFPLLANLREYQPPGVDVVCRGVKHLRHTFETIPWSTTLFAPGWLNQADTPCLPIVSPARVLFCVWII